MTSDPLTALVCPTIVPLCKRNDSSTRKPAREPLPAIQTPSGEGGVVFIVPVVRCGSCNGVGAEPTMASDRMTGRAINTTNPIHAITTNAFTVHLFTVPVAILRVLSD